MRETDEVAARRLACMEMRDLLLKAMEIVNEVSRTRSFDVYSNNFLFLSYFSRFETLTYLISKRTIQ
jgi:hypothetical protein